MNLYRLRSFLEHQAIRLHQESLVHRFVGKVSYKGRNLLPDDQVKPLNGRPLAMFFYNLRAMFLGSCMVFLIILVLLVSVLPAGPRAMLSTAVLAIAWLADVGITLYFHKSFIKKLGKWVQQESSSELPPLFNRYFVLDSVIVFLLVVAGKIWHLGFDAFVFLLLANIVVYTAYFPTVHRLSRVITIIFFALVLSFLLLFVAGAQREEPRWFQVLLSAAPLLVTAFVIVLSVLIISQLRAIEHEITISRLKLLGVYGDKLSPPLIALKPPSCKPEVDVNAQEFRKQISDVLKEICTLGDPFWYRSACLWFAETHQDRGELLLPAAWYEFPEAEQYLQGIPATHGLLRSTSLLLVHSLKSQQGEWMATPGDFRHDLDAPAAFIPLSRGDVRVGLLALYGEENGPPLQRQDEEFLTTFGSMISNTFEEWESFYQSQPQSQMDELFKCEHLQEVFQSTVSILQEYLGAAGCMVIFRPNPDQKEMRVAAKIGISDQIYKKNIYEVGKGLTGKCAETGQAIRIDDVPTHRDEFDAELLRGLEKAHKPTHGERIISWMAIPIGTKRNYGVIKMVNRRFRAPWFSKRDEQLGLSLALRLQVIIEKFLSFERMKEAVDKAEANSAEAKRLLEQRQEDLMVTMHQLQGPLASMLGSISYLQEKLLQREILRILPWSVSRTVEEQLTSLEDFVTDSTELSYGTFTTFAMEAGRPARFSIHNIDAPKELKKLAERLRKTNARSDLTFSFHAEPDFPILRMDKRVFTSVFYSLIHNAMKYADAHSEVSLICATEGYADEPVLKVKSVGEPILPSEKDVIFQKFGRGRVVSDGRHNSGVGLGLWVAKELMRTIKGDDGQKGDLTVELSARFPRLSVFVVHIPKVKEKPKPVQPTRSGSS